MNWQSVSFDWNQARAFLATAEEGSLSAAADALGLTQPTLSRQVASLEDNLGVMLFERVGRSLALTQTGIDLLDHFRAMGEAAGRISLTASGQSQAIEGRVSISATDIMATYHLPPMVKKLHQIAPGIEIELTASNSISDLTRREADIAVRHVRPEQPELIAKLVTEARAHLYASTEFLDKVGRPEKLSDLSSLDFVGVDTNHSRLVTELNARGIPVSEDNLKMTTASGTVLLALVREGLGVSILPYDLCSTMPELEIVLPDLDPIYFPVWLVTHRELNTSRRIRVVFDLLADELAKEMPG
ncbi:MAG: LysR family transcriptional regulator [Hyphococcus sp.]|nr:MAG: LysR family transcriptional regulator [Marinicaulis sp.]